MNSPKTHKVLIITYYWPPSGGAGVQRWLKTSKYLREFGWEPVIFTPLNPEVPVVDHSLVNDVAAGLEIIRIPIWEPYSFYKKLVGLKPAERISAGFLAEKKKPGMLENISVWLRGNLFIPDARKFWIKPATRFLLEYLKEHPIDALISTGPPHSMHLIAKSLHQQLHIPWLADFRDPWTGIDYYDQLKIGKRADNVHQRMEKDVLGSADCVTVVSSNMQKEFQKILPREYHIIFNGYDTDDLSTPTTKKSNDRFRITHAGSITPTRNPESLWKALAELVRESDSFSSDLEIELIGKYDYSVLESIEQSGLKRFLLTEDYIPHDQLPQRLQESSLLLLLINNVKGSEGIITGKLFEYLASGKPILCIGPTNGDAAQIIAESGSGMTAGFADTGRMKEIISEFYASFKQKELRDTTRSVQHYSRKNLSGKIAGLLNNLVSK